MKLLYGCEFGENMTNVFYSSEYAYFEELLGHATKIN